MTIYTVGYEGCTIEQFIEGLRTNKITGIVDVRKNPISRKKGFSKSKLRESLEAVGISYAHLSELGVPSAWRKKQKAHLMTRPKMFSDYAKKILPKHEEEMREVLKIAKETKRAALLCYESDASDCHRHYLAQALQELRPLKLLISIFFRRNPL